MREHEIWLFHLKVRFITFSKERTTASWLVLLPLLFTSSKLRLFVHLVNIFFKIVCPWVLKLYGYICSNDWNDESTVLNAKTFKTTTITSKPLDFTWTWPIKSLILSQPCTVTPHCYTFIPQTISFGHRDDHTNTFCWNLWISFWISFDCVFFYLITFQTVIYVKSGVSLPTHVHQYLGIKSL